jgi:hypothetical protein
LGGGSGVYTTNVYIYRYLHIQNTEVLFESSLLPISAMLC